MRYREGTLMTDLGSMANKYKNFNSLKDFVDTINYLEEKLNSDRGHKGDLVEKINRLKLYSVTYMQNLQKGSQKTTPEDLAQNGAAFLEKFGPDKNSQNYSNTAIKFKEWVGKQPKPQEQKNTVENTAPAKKLSWFDRHPWVSDAAKVLVTGTTIVGVSAVTLNPALGIGTAAALGVGTTVGLGVASYGVIKAAQGIEAARDMADRRKETKKEKTKAKAKENEPKTKTSFFSKVKSWWKDKNHFGLKTALKFGAVSSVVIGTTALTLNPALGIGAAAAYGVGATAALSVGGVAVVGLVKGIENIKDRLTDRKIAKIINNANQKAPEHRMIELNPEHKNTKELSQEMLNKNKERKAAAEKAKIVEMYPNGKGRPTSNKVQQEIIIKNLQQKELS